MGEGAKRRQERKTIPDRHEPVVAALLPIDIENLENTEHVENR
jgi:hypothetical protein